MVAQKTTPDREAARVDPAQRITWTLRRGTYAAAPTAGSGAPSPRADTMAEKVDAARPALQQKDAHDRSAAPSPGAATWRWDLATDSVDWDHGLELLFGYGERVTDSAWRRNLIHPRDRDGVETSLQRATIRNDGGPWSERYRLQQADGSYTHVGERAYILHDDAGPRSVVGAITVRALGDSPDPPSRAGGEPRS